MNEYLHIPDLKSVFRATLDCCYEQVLYDGPEIGVLYRTDEPENGLNSGVLICRCHPKLDILPIPETKYLEILNDVNQRRSHLYN